MKYIKGESIADGDEGKEKLEVSEDSKKLDALMDMLKDSAAKIDEGHRRLDARMDAFEKFREDSERRDSERRDAEEKGRADKGRADKGHKDGEEPEEKGDPVPPVADKGRKDSEEEEKRREDARRKDSEEEKRREDARRKDSEEEEKRREDTRRDSKRKDGDEMEMDNQYVPRSELEALRHQIAQLQVRAPEIISDSDRVHFADIQEAAEPVFQAFGDHAPRPLDGETPLLYQRRLATKLQAHSPRWKEARLTSISDQVMLDAVVSDIYADSLSAARRGSDVPAGQLRMVSRNEGGHTINEFVGDTSSWMDGLAGNSQRGTGEWRRPH